MTQSCLAGNAALVIWGDVKGSNVDEAALNEWWTNEHLPERMSLPGFLRARRYSFRDDSADTTHYLTLYETAEMKNLTSPAYMERLNNPTPGTAHHVPTLAAMTRAACEVLHSQKRAEYASIKVSGATVWLVECPLSGESDIARLSDSIRQKTHEWLAADTGLMSCSLLKEDAEVTAPGSSSQSYLNSNLETSRHIIGIRCIILLEFSKPAAHVQISDSCLRVGEQVYSTLHSLAGPEVPISRIYAYLAGVSA